MKNNKILVVLDLADVRRLRNACDAFADRVAEGDIGRATENAHTKCLADSMQAIIDPVTFPEEHPANTMRRASREYLDAFVRIAGLVCVHLATEPHLPNSADLYAQVPDWAVDFCDENADVTWGVDKEFPDTVFNFVQERIDALSRLAAKEGQREEDSEDRYAYRRAWHQRVAGIWFRIVDNKIVDQDQYRHDLESRADKPAPATSDKPEEGKR